jgi:maltooligosyltrehalose trehalohydrolase
VVFDQNHDQVGNRFAGDRLSNLLSTEQLRLVAGVVLLAPYVPLLFMGEEYGELAPFHYFVSHTDPVLVENVRRGRRNEFAAFGWGEDVPDPQDAATFESSRLDHALEEKEPHASIRSLYRDLLHLRRTHPALRTLDKEAMDVHAEEDRRLMTVRRWSGREEVLALFSFGDARPSCPEGWSPLIEEALFCVYGRSG